MFQIEKKVWEFVEKYRNYFFLGIVTLLALMIRYAGRDVCSNDMLFYLAPWYNEIWEAGGLRALKSQVGNYNVVYQTLIALFTYIDINCVYAYKIVSVVFDFLVALVSASLVCEMTKKKKCDMLFCLTYAAMLFLPTNVINSAYWGQCDAIYTFFVLMTILYLYREKYVRAFIFLGLAFAFKLQAVFILPFIICYYLYRKKFSIIMFAIPVAVFWLSGLPAYIFGRELNTPFVIYMEQADEYHSMYMNIPSFWMLVGEDYEILNRGAIIITFVLCGVALYTIISGIKKIDSAEQFLNTATWFVWTCVLFLPSMHERYTYPLDILLVVLAFVNKKYVKYALVSSTLSLITYGIYFFNNGSLDKFYALIFLATWLHYTYFIIKQDEPSSDYCA